MLLLPVMVVGGDLSVMGRRAIVVEPLSHANVKADTQIHTGFSVNQQLL